MRRLSVPHRLAFRSPLPLRLHRPLLLASSARLLCRRSAVDPPSSISAASSTSSAATSRCPLLLASSTCSMHRRSAEDPPLSVPDTSSASAAATGIAGRRRAPALQYCGDVMWIWLRSSRFWNYRVRWMRLLLLACCSV